MRTARLTVLLKEDEKAEWEARAAHRGVSSSEYVRQIVNDEERITAEEEAELAALVREANEAIPKMRASLDRMLETLDRSHSETDAFLKRMGVRP
ncbi:MAG TPA: hypothetical protein VGW34_06270 [Allosphingosinicella sp.]|nr:hypothetical protein [Allosphingosinicella sp.]